MPTRDLAARQGKVFEDKPSCGLLDSGHRCTSCNSTRAAGRGCWCRRHPSRPRVRMQGVQSPQGPKVGGTVRPSPECPRMASGDGRAGTGIRHLASHSQSCTETRGSYEASPQDRASGPSAGNTSSDASTPRAGPRTHSRRACKGASGSWRRWAAAPPQTTVSKACTRSHCLALMNSVRSRRSGLINGAPCSSPTPAACTWATCHRFFPAGTH